MSNLDQSENPEQISEDKTLVGSELDGPTKRKAGMPSWLKTVLAIVVSVLIIAYYFKGLDWGKFVSATQDADLGLAFVSMLIPQLVFWLFHVYQVDRIFTWFHQPFAWKDFLWVRGGLYLAMMVNTGVGGAATVLYLQRKTRVTWTKYLSINVFRGWAQAAFTGIFLIPLSLYMHATGIFEKTPLNPYIWWTILIGGQLAFWDGWHYFLNNKAIGLSRYFFTEGEFEGNLIGGLRNRKHEFWRTFNEATKAQWVIVMLWTLLPLVSFIIGFWYCALAFNIEIPFVLFACTIIVVLMIQDMPFAFAGFGAATMAWSLFYSDYASPEAIASLTLCMPIMRLAIRAGIGLVCIRPALSDISSLFAEMKNNKPRDLKDPGAVL